MTATPKYDYLLALTVLGLLVFGLVMITSIGVPKSISLSAPGILYPNCSDTGVDCYLLFKKHLFRLGAGLIALLFAFKMPIRFWSRTSKILYMATVILLLVVVFFGKSFNTIATNWLNIFNTSIQPSEFAKLSLAIYLSYWFSKQGVFVKSLKDGFAPFIVVSGFVLVPVMMQNDFGNTLVLSMVAGAIYIVAGARIRHLLIGFLCAILLIAVIVSTVDHVRERFTGYTKIDQSCTEDYCWQSQQANIAVGSGGFFGKGLTQGVQKSYWLPQASDDFIFAASAEELGFSRIILVVLAYFYIAYRGLLIASRAENQFEKYLATGITVFIAGQAFINIAVNLALMPVTGLTLPFVSYGGSSLVTSLLGVGILLNISKNSVYANSSNRRGYRRTYHPQPGRYKRA
ncbi:MAG: putative peptidoglycan glycosyltransferase FtsW [Candidatus Gracilibacteria bacterium]|jgi:cell division protein FtsW|nr:putative peptidoglycan glycosyltransferase FtsW [Candidatus Gracilibacteria bacterium]